jgi:hypothetical protein
MTIGILQCDCCTVMAQGVLRTAREEWMMARVFQATEGGTAVVTPVPTAASVPHHAAVDVTRESSRARDDGAPPLATDFSHTVSGYEISPPGGGRVFLLGHYPRIPIRVAQKIVPRLYE